MRNNIVAGNWKMNKDLDEGLKLASEIVNMVKDENIKGTKVVLAPPYIHLNSLARITDGVDSLYLGAQNCSQHSAGAYTGEISAPMLRSVKVQYVIIGHSERREYFKEDHKQLAEKVNAALENGLIPIFCCGEPLTVREEEKHFDYVCNQLTESIFHLGAGEFSKLVIAYEPIWAIGTGKTASSAQAQEMHARLREHISKKFGKEIADETTILYGGSCKPDNARELFACPDVDGGLIGGASLKSRDFMDIIKSF